MIDITVTDNTVFTTSTGKLVEKDYEKILPIVNGLIKKYDAIRWYFEMRDFEGWSLEAFWKDIKFDLVHASDFEKIAMVGEKKWQEALTVLMKPFTKAKIKFFPLEEKDKAAKWIVTDKVD
jgi:hypothetical protein